MDIVSWAGLLLGVVGVMVAYLAYRSQRGRRRLEYLVIGSFTVVPPQLSTALSVTYNRARISDAAVAILRLVNTGDRAILAAQFEASLTVRAEGSKKVVAAVPSRTRPQGLNPILSIETDGVAIAPMLLNPGDMIELQIITSGPPSRVTVSGRIADAVILQRASLPYAPGIGSEGQLTPADKLIWNVLTPVLLVGAFSGLILSTPLALAAKLSLTGGVIALSLLAGPGASRFFDRRRAMWR
jgi:hypothetical protein